MARSPHSTHMICRIRFCCPTVLHYNAVFVINVKKFMPSWTHHDGPLPGVCPEQHFFREEKIGFDLEKNCEFKTETNWVAKKT